MGGEDLFVTCNPPEGLIEPAKVVKTMRWQHLVCDGVHPVRSAELHRIQGKRRTYFCGEYAGLFGHEMAFTSGLAVGKALGGEFPFTDSEFARRSFYDLAVHHMKVVRPEDAPVEESPTWWPRRRWRACSPRCCADWWRTRCGGAWREASAAAAPGAAAVGAGGGGHGGRPRLALRRAAQAEEAEGLSREYPGPGLRIRPLPEGEGGGGVAPDYFDAGAGTLPFTGRYFMPSSLKRKE